MDAPATTVAREYKTLEEKQLTEFFTAFARDGHFMTVKGLIKEAKADINAHNVLGLTAFQLAHWNQHQKIVDLLIEKGVKNQNTNFILDEHLTKAPCFKLDPVLEQRRKEIEQYALEDLLIEHVRLGHVMVVTGLIEEVGVDINAKNLFGLTPLIQAAQNDKLEIVKLLLQKGVDQDAGHAYGYSALRSVYGKKSKKEIISLLLNALTPEQLETFFNIFDPERIGMKVFEAAELPLHTAPLVFSQINMVAANAHSEERMDVSPEIIRRNKFNS